MSFVASKPPVGASALSTPGAMAETHEHPEGARGAGYLGDVGKRQAVFHRAPDDDRFRKVVWNPVTRKYVVVVMPEDYIEDEGDNTNPALNAVAGDGSHDDDDDDEMLLKEEFYDEEDEEFDNLSSR
ncbi:hypothetical protein CS022_21680 [Veronia nyctiphanis]|uniref:Uncharacterized protein n=1 Tax=Veronia nyctiphanis TaxID=1278244 RepID=A0A4Q0YK99_9GAMM|nr:hypothetical protein [Veronia nyctiphanis]RXJ71152.1 hypothetical protein CS022_21680 [Veronia nyctiphanis]